MKKSVFSIFLFLVGLTLTKAQEAPPQGISYQAVAIDERGIEISGVDAKGRIVPEKAIKVRFSIIKDTPSGVLEYSEWHLTNTDRYGLFSLTIGKGTVESTGVFKDIDWGSGYKFLKVELDIHNDGNYKVVANQQLMSVPYALYAQKVIGGSGSDTTYKKDLNALKDSIQKLKNQMAIYVSSDRDTSPLNEIQKMTYNNGHLKLTLSSDSIALIDQDSVNELQRLTLNNDTLNLSKDGGTVILPKRSGSFLSDTLNPTGTIGVDGDFFINSKTSLLYGPKKSGNWGAGTSLIGPKGVDGKSDTSHYIGEIYGGGIIAAVWKENGVEHGLIVSISDLQDTVWSNISNAIGDSARFLSNGYINSLSIISQNGHNISAAKLCLDLTTNGYNDWYLPSLFELKLIQQSIFTLNLNLPIMNKIKETDYWSSNEIKGNPLQGYGIRFNGDTGLVGISKLSNAKIRAVRRY